MINECQKVLIKSRELRKKWSEKTIFSIGGRGHYENPITDILSFYFNPKEEHKLNDLFLCSIFQLLQKNKRPTDLTIVKPPEREVITEENNRIDLVVEGEDWVLVIENKIYHKTNNPFCDYENFIKKTYNDKVKYFVILSISKESSEGVWENVLYSEFIKEIQHNYGHYLMYATNNKWHVFLRDFLINLNNQIGIMLVSPDRLDFVRKNYKYIVEINNMHNEYLKDIENKGLECLRSTFSGQNVACTSSIEDWLEGNFAIRLYSDFWTKKTNINIVIGKTGEMSVQVYVHGINDSQESLLADVMMNVFCENYWTEAKTIRCFSDDKVYENISDVLITICNSAKAITSFFEKLK